METSIAIPHVGMTNGEKTQKRRCPIIVPGSASTRMNIVKELFNSSKVISSNCKHPYGFDVL